MRREREALKAAKLREANHRDFKEDKQWFIDTFKKVVKQVE